MNNDSRDQSENFSESFFQDSDNEVSRAADTDSDVEAAAVSVDLQLAEEMQRVERLAVREPPGLPETVAWILLFFIGQLVAMVVVFAVGFALLLPPAEQPVESLDLSRLLESVGPTGKLTLVALPTLLCYLVLIPLGWWRLSPRVSKRLNFSLPSFAQVLIASSLVLPLTISADAVMKGLDPYWQQLVLDYPALEGFNNSDVHKLLAQFNEASLLVAVFFIAVVPGIGEEFLFRGIIGRGLVSRWGVVPGVLLTSLFFGMVHMYPPHVAAAFLVGIGLHWVYLTTKSFWAPVMCHFLNNALAVLLMRAPQDEEPVHPAILAVCVAYCVWCLIWLYRLRTVYHRDGVSVADETFSVAEPQGTVQRSSHSHWLPLVAAGLMLALAVLLVAQAFQTVPEDVITA